MSLARYRQKRRFEETPEPLGEEEPSTGVLRFVVQKHDASHLHYDLRLEMGGVLKSWVVPKGPSLRPAERRLAMMAEDHPLSYRTFEGTIPAGNYGAGTVMVWDEGTYRAADGDEETLLRDLERGSLSVVLHGKKIAGEFALVQMPRAGEKAWLLMKRDDEHAADRDVSEEDRSVRTGRTMEKIASGPQ